MLPSPVTSIPSSPIEVETGETTTIAAVTAAMTISSTTAPTTPRVSSSSLLQQAAKKKRSRSSKVIHGIRSAFRSFPILTPACRFPTGVTGASGPHGHIHGASRITGTLYGPRRSRISFAIQENPKSIPMLVLELGVPTGKLLQEIGSGLARIALECEKKVGKTKLLDEPTWTMFCNGRKTGYGAKRDPNEVDLNVMQLLHSVSMGVAVLPSSSDSQEQMDGELTYMRAFFDRVTGSRDSETFYMVNPETNMGPDLSIFFIRL